MSAWVARGAILLAGGLLALAALPAQAVIRWSLLGLLSLLLGLWLGSYFTWLRRLPTAGLLGTLGLAAAALYFRLNAALVVTAFLMALIGWDLDLFARRVRAFKRIEGGVVGRHLRATLIVGLISLGSVLLGLHVSSTVSFWPAVLLAAVSFASLVALLRLSSS